MSKVCYSLLSGFVSEQRTWTESDEESNEGEKEGGRHGGDLKKRILDRHGLAPCVVLLRVCARCFPFPLSTVIVDDVRGSNC